MLLGCSMTRDEANVQGLSSLVRNAALTRWREPDVNDLLPRVVESRRGMVNDKARPSSRAAKRLRIRGIYEQIYLLRV